MTKTIKKIGKAKPLEFVWINKRTQDLVVFNLDVTIVLFHFGHDPKRWIYLGLL